MEPSFGDNVEIRGAPETEDSGLAGRRGQVHGITTPSLTGVDVIGASAGDVAVNVHFEELGIGYWFAPELVQVIDHAPGTEIRFDGVPKSWVREEDGSWTEREDPPSQHRRWWEFWR